jgi:hypothetical protein
MFKNSPFAGFTRLHGNGALPRISWVGGTPSLVAALARVEAVEGTLAEARAAARAAARREGKPVAGLFGESRFILRATREKWTDAARLEGMHAVTRAIQIAPAWTWILNSGTSLLVFGGTRNRTIRL